MMQETDWINIRTVLLPRLRCSWGGSEPRGPDLTLVAGFLWLHVGSRLWGGEGYRRPRKRQLGGPGGRGWRLGQRGQWRGRRV